DEHRFAHVVENRLQQFALLRARLFVLAALGDVAHDREDAGLRAELNRRGVDVDRDAPAVFRDVDALAAIRPLPALHAQAIAKSLGEFGGVDVARRQAQELIARVAKAL